MIEKITKFTGYSSGDYECFCFAVSLKDFEKYAEEYELEDIKDQENSFYEKMYSLYPHHILPDLEEDQKYEFEIIIKAKEIE